MIFSQKSLITILLLFCSIPVLAQKDSIDLFINNQMQKRKIPGLELAIVRHGKIVKTGYYGLANIQDSIPVTHKSVFTINSITKAFVGVAVIQLMEEGKLKLNAPISEYLSEIPESWKTATVLQLLSHTSGIPDVVDEEESVMIADNFNLSWKKVLAMPNDFKPGEEFRYNQTNYYLLGQIINKSSGMSFQEFITKKQLQKAGMEKTIQSGFGAVKEIVPHAANSYQFSKGKLNNMFFSFPPELQTAAGMSSTANEMAKWVIALQNMEFFKQKSSLEALWKPALLNNGKTAGFSRLLNGYAAGWPVIDRTEHPAAAPVGGGRSAVFVYPKDALSIIILTNLSGGSPDVFIDELAGLFIPDMKEANGFGMSPSGKSMKLILDKTGYKNAIETANKLKLKNKDFTLTEDEVNNWGYKLIGQKRLKDALELFKLNVSLYPSSGNAFDSLGETYAELEENELAIKNYEKAFQLNPQNKNAEQQIIRLKSKQ
ncbi:serine hydrolase [Chryseobacterium shigense]|uniref:CubicO group peptidase, beta-lactamase class C family n=1 Tax=Chryseobacterium shigense TaxID=297244 RepID=A0A1N7HZE8_9FLAO|nr:serine hydrolase [Chryseobacterium shigense]PQA90868.1 serine hydrolase [Chryseobacterium shigense]SIS30100.1 CubicO group peptidase, beta-lactamase class C family [Chryseobacterium shigense]